MGKVRHETLTGRKKLVIIEGIDRIGKSSFVIPFVEKTLRELYAKHTECYKYQPMIRTLNDDEAEAYAACMTNAKISEQGLLVHKNNKLFSDIGTMYSPYYLFAMTDDALIMNRASASMLVYSKLFGREKQLSETGLEWKDYLDGVRCYENRLEACFDVAEIVLTWKDKTNCIQDEILTLDQSKEVNELFKNYHNENLFFNTGISNCLLLELDNDENGLADYSYAKDKITSFLDKSIFLKNEISITKGEIVKT